jgi:hypothetical protein
MIDPSEGGMGIQPVIAALIGAAVALSITFVLTWITYKDDPKVIEKAKEEELQAA